MKRVLFPTAVFSALASGKKEEQANSTIPVISKPHLNLRNLKGPVIAFLDKSVVRHKRFTQVIPENSIYRHRF